MIDLEGMMEPRSEWSRNWPEWVSTTLAEVGISRYDTLAVMSHKVEALGLMIDVAPVAQTDRTPGIMLHAEVRDRNDPRAAIGQHDSATDHADALAWATAKLLRERVRQRAAQAERFAALEADSLRQLSRRVPPLVEGYRHVGDRRVTGGV
jgi:hypothetical protein